MNHAELIARLLALPSQLAAMESAVLDAENDRRAFEDSLTQRSDALRLAGVVDGKNEVIRNAQLRTATAAPRLELLRAEESLSRRKIALRRIQAEHSSLKAIARLLAENE